MNNNKVKNILQLLRGSIDSTGIESNIMEFITGKMEYPKTIMQNNLSLKGYKVFKIKLHDWVDDYPETKENYIKHDFIIQFIGDKNGGEPYNYPPNIMEYYKDLSKIYDKFYFAEELITNGKKYYKCSPNNMTDYKEIETVTLFVKEFKLVAVYLLEDKDIINCEKTVSYLLNDLSIKLDPKNSQDYEESDDDESEEEDVYYADRDAYYAEQYLNSLANPSVITQEMADALYGDDEILP